MATYESGFPDIPARGTQAQDIAVEMTIQVRVLCRAAAVVGGVAALASLLGIDANELRRWMNDEAVPPARTFLRAVDLTILNDCQILGRAGAAQRLSHELRSRLERAA
jgi:DNA-binding transcriptional regulator YdaS (Cro superfamily)